MIPVLILFSSIDDFWDDLLKHLENKSHVYYDFLYSLSWREKLLNTIKMVRKKKRGGIGPTHLLDIAEIMGDLRRFKDSLELEAIKKSVAVANAFTS